MLSSFKSKIGNVYCPVYILELLTSVFGLTLHQNFFDFAKVQVKIRSGLAEDKKYETRMNELRILQ